VSRLTSAIRDVAQRRSGARSVLMVHQAFLQGREQLAVFSSGVPTAMRGAMRQQRYRQLDAFLINAPRAYRWPRTWSGASATRASEIMLAWLGKTRHARQAWPAPPGGAGALRPQLQGRLRGIHRGMLEGRRRGTRQLSTLDVVGRPQPCRSGRPARLRPIRMAHAARRPGRTWSRCAHRRHMPCVGAARSM